MKDKKAVPTPIKKFSNHIHRDKTRYCTQALSVTLWCRAPKPEERKHHPEKKKRKQHKETFILRIGFLYSGGINELVVWALARFCAGSALCVTVEVVLVEKKCVFLVWSLAWEQPESGHRTTLRRPRADRGGNAHLPAQHRYLPSPCGPLTHIHTQNQSYTYAHTRAELFATTINQIGLQIVRDGGSTPSKFRDQAENNDNIFTSAKTCCTSVFWELLVVRYLKLNWSV